MTLGSTEDPTSPLLSPPHSCPHATGHGPFIAAGFGDTRASRASPTIMPQECPPCRCSHPYPRSRVPCAEPLQSGGRGQAGLCLPSALSPCWRTPNPRSGVVLSQACWQHLPHSEKGGWWEEEALGSPTSTPSGAKPTPPTLTAKLSPAPESGMEGQTEPSVCRGNAPTQRGAPGLRHGSKGLMTLQQEEFLTCFHS